MKSRVGQNFIKDINGLIFDRKVSKMIMILSNVMPDHNLLYLIRTILYLL